MTNCFSPILHLLFFPNYVKLNTRNFCLLCVITWYSAAGDFHVELNRVHAQNGVAHMAEQVSSRDHASEGRQFTQLLQLLLPPGGQDGQERGVSLCPASGRRMRRPYSLPFIRHVDVGAELDVL